MGKAGEKQKRRPKFKDKKQSERFKETAREIGADESSDVFDRIVDEMARDKAHIKSSADMVRKSRDEIRDVQRHVSESEGAVKRSKRHLKKVRD
jgi:hypothetical protein